MPLGEEANAYQRAGIPFAEIFSTVPIKQEARKSSSRVLASLLVISLLLMTGCSGGKDKKAAIEAINKGMRKDALSVHVLLGRVSPKCAPIVHAGGNQDLTTVTDYQAAEKGGLIS